MSKFTFFSHLIAACTVLLGAGYTAPAYAALIGNIDGVTLGASGATVSGWACLTGSADPTVVDVYAGVAGSGTFLTGNWSNAPSEPGVATACQSAGPHRFNFLVSLSQLASFQGQAVHVYTFAGSGGAVAELGQSGKFTLPAFPNPAEAFIDGVKATSAGIEVDGWACQDNLNQAIGAQLYVGGTAASNLVQTIVATNISRPDVNAHCKTSTSVNHGFSFVIPKLTAVKFINQPISVLATPVTAGLAPLLAAQSGKFSVPGAINLDLSELAINSGAPLIIAAGENVQINQNLDVGDLTVNGRLYCPPSGSFTIKTTSLMINGASAVLECGTQSARFGGNLQIALKASGRADADVANRGILVVNGGTLRLTGSGNGSAWTRLAQNANPGDTILQLARPRGWAVGSQIGLAPTSYNPFEAEQLTIKSISADGLTIQTVEPLKYLHWGQTQSFPGSSHLDASGHTVNSWSIHEQAEVANLTRNIAIYADGDPVSGYKSDSDLLGAHVMVMPGAYGYVDGVEFHHVGRAGIMARYPFHWHRAGNVKGQYIVNSSIHHSYQRCVTVHGTDNATVVNNVCYDHYGHGFFLEDGDEQGNTITGNLGILSRRPLPGKNLLSSDINISNSDRFPGPATFWVSNPNNNISGNVAAGSQGTGFWMSFHKNLYCDGNRVCVPVADSRQPPTLQPFALPTLNFSNNTAHSVKVGMTWDGVDEGPLTGNPNNDEDRAVVPRQYSPPNVPTFNNLTIYKASRAATYVRANPVNFNNLLIADSNVALFFAFNTQVTNSGVIALTQNHRAQDLIPAVPGEEKFTWEMTGTRIYDGPFDLEGVDYLNYPSQTIQDSNGNSITPTPIVLVGGAGRYINTVQNLHFIPEPIHRVDFSSILSPSTNFWADADSSPGVRDLDGSLGGVANTILVPSITFNLDSTCESAPGIYHGLRCNYTKGLVSFFPIINNNGASHVWFQAQRNDGVATKTMDQLQSYISYGGDQNKVGLVLDRGYEYNLIFNPSYYVMPGPASGGNWLPNSFLVFFDAEKIGQDSPVVSFTGLGRNCFLVPSGDVTTGKLNYPLQTSSLEALRAVQGQNAYFTTSSTLYAKFSATNMVYNNDYGSRPAMRPSSHTAQAPYAMVNCTP